MSDYTNRVVLIIPEDDSIIATAKAASRALDPDTGGYAAFERVVTDGTNNFRIYASPITAEIAAAMPQMQGYPPALKQMIDADYALRWPEDTPPTLVEVEAFTAAVEMYPDMNIETVLQERGLVYADDISDPS